MAHTQPIFLPFSAGLDVSKSAVLGPPELQVATNVDYSIDGEIRGRPGRGAAQNFVVRVPHASDPNTPAYNSAVAFSSTGFAAAGLITIREPAGDTPALVCHGRLFVKEASRWMDRGPIGCMQVDRLARFRTRPTAGLVRDAAAQDFGLHSLVNNHLWGLLTAASSLDRVVDTAATFAVGPVSSGNSARTGTTTGVVVLVDTGGAAHDLVLITRSAGADTLSTYTLASDARLTSLSSEDGEAPSICSSPDVADTFWVAYRTTVAGQAKILRVTASTGAVTATQTESFTDLKGLWIDAASAAADFVLLAMTSTSLGLRLRKQSHDLATSLGTTTTAGYGSGVVVVGRETDARYWFASKTGADLTMGDIDTATTTPTLFRTFYAAGSGAHPQAEIEWSIVHQPVVVGGRAYITICAAADIASLVGTWITLDLSNWRVTAAAGEITGPFNNPTPVARGPTDTTFLTNQPASAVALTDGTGWTFPTVDFSRFGVTAAGVITGVEAATVVNQVKLTKPRATSLGQSTVISGSVPFAVEGGQASELGFVFNAGRPGLEATSVTGTGLTDGTYEIVAVWKWTDAAGIIHRSGPSPVRSVIVPAAPPSQAIEARVTNPWLRSKETGSIKLEVYAGAKDTTGGPYFLMASADPVFASAFTLVTIVQNDVDNPGETLYTNVTSGTLANVHVVADGGVAALGRRLWMAGASDLHASKLLASSESSDTEAGMFPGFNDEGPLAVQLPAGAGRIRSLESVDDKLVVCCERGIYLVQDGGPDNTGTGPDFASPFHRSNLGVPGARSTYLTDRGVVFVTALGTTDANLGGPWLLDRSFGAPQYLGRPALSNFLGVASWVPEVAYSPQRQQVYLTSNIAGSGADGTGLVVMDLRSGRWSTWDQRGDDHGEIQSIECYGALMTLGDGPAFFDLTPGSDTGGGNYAMDIRTSHLSATGSDPLMWSRVRSVRPVSGDGSGTHTLSMTASLDQRNELGSGSIAVAAPGSDTTWPTSRQDPEWRLPIQKCSQIQVEMSATPAVARWAGLRLDVVPQRFPAPAKQRS